MKIHGLFQLQEGIGEDQIQRIIKAQNLVASKRKELDEEREIKKDFERKVQEHDKREKARNAAEGTTTKGGKNFERKRSTDKMISRKRHSNDEEDSVSKNVKHDRKSEERNLPKVSVGANRSASSAK